MARLMQIGMAEEMPKSNRRTIDSAAPKATWDTRHDQCVINTGFHGKVVPEQQC